MTTADEIYLASCPWELQAVIPEFWPDSEYDNAARIAFLESGLYAFALADTTDSEHPCGSYLRTTSDGVRITAERSVGYFQINACNRVDDWHKLYNARFNAEAAYALWQAAGNSWRPWYFSARRLGLIR